MKKKIAKRVEGKMLINARLAVEAFINSIECPNPNVGSLTKAHYVFDQMKIWIKYGDTKRVVNALYAIFGAGFASGAKEYETVFKIDESYKEHPIAVKRVFFQGINRILSQLFTMKLTDENIIKLVDDLGELKRLYQEAGIDADKKGGWLMIPYWNALRNIQLASNKNNIEFGIEFAWTDSDVENKTKAALANEFTHVEEHFVADVVEEGETTTIFDIQPDEISEEEAEQLVNPRSVHLSCSLEDREEGWYKMPVGTRGKTVDKYWISDAWWELAKKSYGIVKDYAIKLGSHKPDPSWLNSKLEELGDRYRESNDFKALCDMGAHFLEIYSSLTSSQQSEIAKVVNNEYDRESREKAEKDVRTKYRSRFAEVVKNLQFSFDMLCRRIPANDRLDWKVEATIFVSYIDKLPEGNGAFKWKAFEEGSSFCCKVLENEFALYNYRITEAEKGNLGCRSKIELDYCTFESGAVVTFENNKAHDDSGCFAILDEDEYDLNGEYTIEIDEDGIPYAVHDIENDLKITPLTREEKLHRVVITSYKKGESAKVSELTRKLKIGSELTFPKRERKDFHNGIFMNGMEIAKFRVPYNINPDIRTVLYDALSLVTPHTRKFIVTDFVKTKDIGDASLIIFGHYDDIL